MSLHRNEPLGGSQESLDERVETVGTAAWLGNFVCSEVMHATRVMAGFGKHGVLQWHPLLSPQGHRQ